MKPTRTPPSTRKAWVWVGAAALVCAGAALPPVEPA